MQLIRTTLEDLKAHVSEGFHLERNFTGTMHYPHHTASSWYLKPEESDFCRPFSVDSICAGIETAMSGTRSAIYFMGHDTEKYRFLANILEEMHPERPENLCQHNPAIYAYCLDIEDPLEEEEAYYFAVVCISDEEIARKFKANYDAQFGQ